MLSQKQLQDICLLFIGDARQCRYVQDDGNYSWICIKHKKLAKNRIDTNIDSFIEDCKKRGINPHKQTVALGDNCKGYPILKNILQGYDVP